MSSLSPRAQSAISPIMSYYPLLMKALYWLLCCCWGGILLMGLPGRVLAQAPVFNRAIICGSGQANYPWGPDKVVVDAVGNSYVTGLFNGTVVLGSNILTATQTNPAAALPSDVFVAKLSAAGNYLWAVQMGDNQMANVKDIAVDGAGDVYLTGGFSSFSVSFGSPSITLFNSSANSEVFIAKLDGATGQWLWAKRAGGGDADGGTAVAVNSTGEVYVTALCGSVSGNTVVDFGPFTFTNLVRNASFIAKLSSAGTWLWARPVGTGAVSVGSMLLDSQNDIVLSGAFAGPSAAFGTTVLTTRGVAGVSASTNGYDLFVARMSDAGLWQWAVQGDAVTNQNLASVNSLASDGLGHLYVAGSYLSASARIGGTLLPNLSATYQLPTSIHRFSDAFAARLDANTGAWQWAARYGGTYAESITGVAADRQGRVYAIGRLNGAGANDETMHLAQINAATGAQLSVQALGNVRAKAVAVNGQGQLRLVGYFEAPTATLGSLILAQAGPNLTTGYLAWLGAGPLFTRPLQTSATLQVWPNPGGRGPVRVQGPAAGLPVQVLDVLGRPVATGRMPATGPLTLPLALPAGVYVVRAGRQACRLVVE